MSKQQLIIIGSGPAGYTAAIYAARAGLKPLVLAGSVTAGGALMNTTEVENFPGFPGGIQGPELMDGLQAQAEKFGAEIVFDDVTSVSLQGHLKSVVTGAGETTLARLVAGTSLITRLARLEEISPQNEVPGESAQFVVGDATYALPLSGVIDISAEKARLEKEVGKLDAEISQVDKKLGNEQFVAKAPEEVIEEQKSRRDAAADRRQKIQDALKRLS